MYKTVIAALISAAGWFVGLAINEHLKDHQRFKETVRTQLIELNRKTGNNRAICTETDAADAYQVIEINEIRDRINRLENDLYEIPDRYTRRTPEHGQTR